MTYTYWKGMCRKVSYKDKREGVTTGSRKSGWYTIMTLVQGRLED